MRIVIRPHWLVVAFALGAPGCAEDEPRPEPTSPQPLLVGPAPRARRPVTLECSFDPASHLSERGATGFDTCFTPSAPPSWMEWLPEPAGDDTAVRFAALASARADGDLAPPEPLACPSDMLLIDGEYCPAMRHECLRYLDEGDGFLSKNRCAEFKQPTVCAAAKQHRRFCIDRDEYTPPGADKPLIEQSWTISKELCESAGKRLCFGSEWEFACSGEDMRPYPYGFARDAKRCNHDLTDLTVRGKLRDLRVKSSDRPDCVSPFGVRNLVGNVDEWVQRDGFIRPWRSGMRGGWWLAGRNNCVAETTAHDEYYHGPQTGTRCCADAR